MNRADEITHLNINEIDKVEEGDNLHLRRYHLLRDKPIYTDVGGEATYKLSGRHGELPSVTWTVVRVRDM